MKTFALAAAAGLLLTAGTADAQFRMRGGSGYSGYRSSSYGYVAPSSYYAPTYGYPSSNYSTYGAPVYGASTYAPVYGSSALGTQVYDGGVVTSGYSPYYGGSSVVVPAGGYSSSYYTPTYGTQVYSGYGATPYYGGSRYYGGFNNGLNLLPSGGNFRGMGWRR